VARNDLEDQRQDGYDELVSFGSGSKTYVVHWDAMTHFTMGTAKNIKVAPLVTVTGTLKGMTIAGTKLDV